MKRAKARTPRASAHPRGAVTLIPLRGAALRRARYRYVEQPIVIVDCRGPA